jgi:hypothetical protein
MWKTKVFHMILWREAIIHNIKKCWTFILRQFNGKNSTFPHIKVRKIFRKKSGTTLKSYKHVLINGTIHSIDAHNTTIYVGIKTTIEVGGGRKANNAKAIVDYSLGSELKLNQDLATKE